ARRAHVRDPAARGPGAAQRGRSQGARVAKRDRRLRGDPGRWRHANRGDHRRLRRARARGAQDHAVADAEERRRRLRRVRQRRADARSRVCRRLDRRRRRERRRELRRPAHRSAGHRRGPAVLQGGLRSGPGPDASRHQSAHRSAARRTAVTERLLIGTGNPGKQREYRELLAGFDLDLVVPADLDPAPPEPDETGATFAENASHKARTYAAASGLRTVADDSGLEVDALRGAPGLRSRRFFGDDATAAERNEKLLALLDGVRSRGARFVCVTALATPDGRVELFDGEVRGEIALSPRGDAGFGYDPLFVIAGDGRTMAELPAHEKHRISHRGLAVAKLRVFLAGEPR